MGEILSHGVRTSAYYTYPVRQSTAPIYMDAAECSVQTTIVPHPRYDVTCKLLLPELELSGYFISIFDLVGKIL